MKYVSLLFAVALIAGVAKAGEVVFNFHYNNPNAYYACSYAESQVAKTLKTLGAENVETDCSGGLDAINNQMWPVSVQASYDVTVKGERQVQFRGNESCDFNVKLIKAALQGFPHEVVKAQSNCWDAKGSYNFVLNLK